jgi:beta-lactamase class A
LFSKTEFVVGVHLDMFRIRTMRTCPFRFLLLLLTLVSVPALAVDSARYAISYLWHRDLASVRAYRDKVVRVLGPAMAERLAVVSNAGLFGLIYDRNGDSAGATRVARAHTRLLRSEGLEASVPVRSQNWVVVGDEITPSMVPEPPKTTDRGGADPTQPATEGTGPSLAKPEPALTSAPRINDLEQAVEDYIKGLRRQGRIDADERTGWSVYDFTTGEKLVTINEDEQFQAASLIKPFIAAAFFHRVEHGEFVYGPRSRRHMRAMIQHSSNAAADWVMRRVGGPRRVQQILQRYYGNIFRQTAIVEYIPLNGRTYRNKASVHDYSRFLYAVWKGGIPGAGEIKRLMALPGPDRIFRGVEEIPDGTHVYDKTGSTARLCGDMGILSVVGKDGKRYPYTLIGIIEKPDGADNYTAWIRARSEVIRDVSGIVYRGILRYHGEALKIATTDRSAG